MEKPVIEQLVCAIVSIGSGIAFGVSYDLFKALRLRAKNVVLTAVLDIIVCAIGLAMLFLLFMSIGEGQARIYIVLCAVAGALIYFVTASAALLSFFTGVLALISKYLHLIAKPLRIAAKKMKFPAKKAKMFFQNACKRFTIMVQGEVRDKADGTPHPTKAEKEHGNEAQTRRHDNKNRHSRARGVRGDNAVLTEEANGRRSGKTR